MRPLNKLEKDFINCILELDKKKDLIYVHNILSKIYDKNYEIEFITNEINADKDIENIVKLRYKDVQYVGINGIIGDLISLTYFINDLLSQGYLVKEKINDILGYRFINKFEDRNNLIEFEIKSETVKTKFAEFLQYKFYATELLRELKNNNYETFEKKEAKSTRKIAIIGLGIALLSLIMSVLLPIFKHDSIEIKKESIDYYFNKSEKQQKSTDSTSLEMRNKKINKH